MHEVSPMQSSYNCVGTTRCHDVITTLSANLRNIVLHHPMVDHIATNELLIKKPNKVSQTMIVKGPKEKQIFLQFIN